jgi:hypothetical protein
MIGFLYAGDFKMLKKGSEIITPFKYSILRV